MDTEHARLIEIVARAICTANCIDPDALLGVMNPRPRWGVFVKGAIAAIGAVLSEEQRDMAGSDRTRAVKLDPWMVEHDRWRLAHFERLFEALARAECKRQAIDPNDIISDGGHLAWQLVGYEAAVKEMPEPSPSVPPEVGRILARNA
jgi:hypothetical protein